MKPELMISSQSPWTWTNSSTLCKYGYVSHMNLSPTEELELELLLEGILKQYGYDFRNYVETSLFRRLRRIMDKARVKHLTELLPKTLYDKNFFEKMFLSDHHPDVSFFINT